MTTADEVTVRIPPAFQPLTGGARVVAVKGTTIGECLRALAARFPGLKAILFSDGERLSGFITITVNRQLIKDVSEDYPVTAGDELYPFLLFEGG